MEEEEQQAISKQVAEKDSNPIVKALQNEVDNRPGSATPKSVLDEPVAVVDELMTSLLQIQPNDSHESPSSSTSSTRFCQMARSAVEANKDQALKVQAPLGHIDILQGSKDSVQLLLDQLYKCHHQLLSYSAFYEDDECALLNLSALYLKSAKSYLQDAVNLQTYFTEQVGWLLTCNDISIEVRLKDNSLIEPFDQAIAIFSSLNSTLNQCSNQLRRAGNAESAKTIVAKFSQKWSTSEKSWRDWHCQISLASRNSAYHGLAWKLFDESFKQQI